MHNFVRRQCEHSSNPSTIISASDLCNEDVRRLCKEGRLKDAIHTLDVMDQQGIESFSATYACLLQECMHMKALSEGKWVHAHILKNGFKPSIFLGNTLVNMYIRCGSVKDARQVFDRMQKRNVFTWNIMISGYSKHGRAEVALKLFWQMERGCVKPNDVTFISVLKACALLGSLEQGKQIHLCIMKSSFKSHIFLESSLLDMYAKCGSLECARRVFDGMLKRDVVSWNTMITAYVQHGHAEQAFKLFREMEQEEKPDEYTFVSILKACASLAALEEGKQIHANVIECGFESNVFVGNSLIDMYAKCGSIEHAHEVFFKIPKRDVVSWNALIGGYAQLGHAENAFKLFWQMKQEDINPDRFTFGTILKACARLSALKEGKKVHTCIIKSGFESDLFVGNSLVDMYAKCGSIDLARQVFDKMCVRDVVSWNTMLAGYAQHGHAEDAIRLFKQMESEGMNPDEVTFVSILKACASLAVLEEGMKIHANINRNGFESDVFVENSLVDMYAKCGSIGDARKVFDEMHRRDMVSWNAMISGYVQNGHSEEAFILFQQMEQEDREPDKVTFGSILKACANQGALEKGKEIHGHIIDRGFESDVFVGNSLIDMYVKCGNIEHARQVFDKICKKDVVSWNAMIGGYLQYGNAEEAVKLFHQMDSEDINPDQVTFVSMLKACASLAALEKGKQIHACIDESGFELDVFMWNSLVDMYAKCGSIENAHKVFDRMPMHTVVSWNAIIGGYAQHGLGKETLKLVEQMQQEGVRPDHITFVCILSACSHAGLVDEGLMHFNVISQDYGVTPTIEHYACMIDLLSRAGQLEEAQNFLKSMPIQPSSVIWMTLLGACKIYGNVDLAKCVAECIFSVEPQNAAAFVLLSNGYGAAGRWDDKIKCDKINDG